MAGHKETDEGLVVGVVGNLSAALSVNRVRAGGR